MGSLRDLNHALVDHITRDDLSALGAEIHRLERRIDNLFLGGILLGFLAIAMLIVAFAQRIAG